MSRYREGVFALKNRHHVVTVVVCAWLFLISIGLGVALSASSEFKVSVFVADGVGVGVGKAALDGAATSSDADVSIESFAGDGNNARSGATKGLGSSPRGKVVVSVSKL